MAFQFTLAPLLRLRRSVERQYALRLHEASLRVARMQEHLEQLNRYLETAEANDQQRLCLGVTAVELQFAAMTRFQLEQVKMQLQAELRKLELARVQAAHAYQQAYREREGLESLSQQQRRRYQQEDLRRQQRDLDATYLLQHWRKR